MLKIVPIAAFSDNYIWLIHDDTTAAAVDPGDGLATQAYLNEHNLQLTHILVTHDHADHVGGIEYLKDHYNLRVLGPIDSKLTLLDDRLNDGDQFNLFETVFEVMSAKGHTQEHIMFFNTDSKNPVLFSGDVLFSGGCGRIFEGTSADMFASLSKIKALPQDTAIYPAHEYSLSNLEFAAFVEPDNKRIEETKTAYQRKLAQSTPTLPTTLALELDINPFLRTDIPSIQQIIHITQDKNIHDEQNIFAALRRMKDEF
ncbi:hydroxyacylglutathione hydrolase [Marinobacterium jannaschii]|uniref:hydroxyacylglutathione hydrolase n=1 Tax=Marinobacterium jannaschii TaxID=64970 RepID=UPI000485A242|nr:hydroxyacylglutathione hydrolase [Marinobacterium jannaschii]